MNAYKRIYITPYPVMVFLVAKNGEDIN